MFSLVKTSSAFFFCLFLHFFSISASAFEKPKFFTEDYWLSQAENHQKVVHTTFSFAMIPRCLAAAPTTHPNAATRKSCAEAAKTLFTELDSESITLNLTGTNRSFTVAFRKDLLEILKDRRTGFFIQALNQERDFQMLLSNSKVSVAAVAQRIYQKRIDVIRVMATIFQNTTTVKAHLDWLEQQKNKMNSLQLTNLNLVFKFYQQMSMDKINSRVIYEFLSADMTRTGLTAFDSYHFYVPAYLFLKTYRKTKTAWSSWLASYFFNYMYEIVTDKKTRLNFMSDPKKLLKDSSIKDMYAAYYSVAYLLGPDIKPLSLLEFSRMAKNNNRNLERNLLKLTLLKTNSH